nr:copper-binding protein [uncultured Albidiferax sp.]
MKNVKLLLVLAAMLAGSVHAQSTMNTGDVKKEVSASSADMSEGEIRKVDTDNKKITIKHGDIKNLDMPGMTMVFQVKDPAMLDKVKAGDKVRFKAEKANGAIVVTDIQPAK